MDITNPVGNTSVGRANIAQGSFVSDGTIVNVTLGFRPRVVKLFNVTGLNSFEKLASMPAANTIAQVTAGTMSVNTASAVVLTEDGFTISAAAAGTAQTIHWYAAD
jgi:hypothetical protein